MNQYHFSLRAQLESRKKLDFPLNYKILLYIPILKNTIEDIDKLESKINSFAFKDIEGAKKLYSILSEIGGKELVGNAKELSPGTFWSN